MKRTILIVLVWCLICWSPRAELSSGVVAVKPTYNRAELMKIFISPPPEKLETRDELVARRVVSYEHLASLYKTADSGGAGNKYESIWYAVMADLVKQPDYLPGVTYWWNEWMNVGHTTFDIAFIADVQAFKIDRVVMQRAACAATQCWGLGNLETFYKGFFAAALLAGNQLDMPVYLRYAHTEHDVTPHYFSNNASTGYYNVSKTSPEETRHIPLYSRTYFEYMTRRTDLNSYAVAPLNIPSVINFKKAAYSLIPRDPPLPLHFTENGPFQIIFAYRSSIAARGVDNVPEIEAALRHNFPAPEYNLTMIDTSSAIPVFTTQLVWMAEAHVVISTHGAFMMNAIYMRNSSLLIEISGNYPRGEYIQFQRMAYMFGLFYGRVHVENLVEHSQMKFNVSAAEIQEIVDHTKEYFQVKAYLQNPPPSSSSSNIQHHLHSNSSLSLSRDHKLHNGANFHSHFQTHLHHNTTSSDVGNVIHPFHHAHPNHVNTTSKNRLRVRR